MLGGGVVSGSVVDDSCSWHAFLPLDISHTRVWVLRSALPMPLVAMALVPPLPHSLQTPDSDLYHDPGSDTLNTILPPRLIGEVPILVLTSTFLNTGIVSARGFVELLIPDPILGFHAISSRFLMLRLGLRSFDVIASSSDVVSMMPQTTHSVVHLSMSC